MIDANSDVKKRRADGGALLFRTPVARWHGACASARAPRTCSSSSARPGNSARTMGRFALPLRYGISDGAGDDGQW